MDYAQMLRPCGQVSDKKNFLLWEAGRINTKECWERFLASNKIKEAPDFDSAGFQYFLAGMGYRRRWWMIPKEDQEDAIEAAQ